MIGLDKIYVPIVIIISIGLELFKIIIFCNIMVMKFVFINLRSIINTIFLIIIEITDSEMVHLNFKI